MTYGQVSGPALVVEHTGQVFPLAGGVVTIGTDEDNTIVLADPRVSSHHARIFWDPGTGAYIIEDLGSVEGTFLNERPVMGGQVMADGDVLRIGDTVMDVDLAGEVAPAPLRRRSPLLAGIVVVFLAGITIVCAILLGILLLSGRRGTPSVTIRSPGDGDRITLGTPVLLQATASGASDITLLEISVDGLVIGSTPSDDRGGTSLLSASDTWVFETPGQHEISAVAYTARERVSTPARVVVEVAATVPTSPPPTVLPSETPLATDTPLPTDTPELLATDTPTPTLTPTPTPTSAPPAIAYLRANPASVEAGDCAALEWGTVTDATSISVAPRIGEVTAPGSRLVCPEETTTYTLSAAGPGGTTTASVTVEVIPRLPDLLVESISFDPAVPTQGQNAQVRIAIRNVGQGEAAPFDWEWRAGSDATLDGRIPGLAAGEATVATATWTPGEAYASLLTEARVDVAQEVEEESESNNSLAAIVTVVPGEVEPETAVLLSQAALDGYVLNNGSAVTGEDVFVGNGQIEDDAGERVSRGFLSFDLSSIPAGATIERVELRFFQKQIVGNPYDTLGNLVLDHVSYGGQLEGSAFDAPSLHTAMLAQQTQERAWYIVSDPGFVSWVESGLASASGRFQLRLRFSNELDGDGEEDWIAIEPGGGPLGNQSAPQLIVVYRP